MRLTSAFLTLLIAESAIAFSPAFVHTQHRTTTTTSSSLDAVITGPSGKAATSKEEDLQLTLKIILDHAARSTTVSKDQMISQMEEIKKIPVDIPKVDISVPYDAAAKLAYAKSDKKMAYADFKVKYEADAVADVIAKRKPAAAAAPAPVAAVAVDISVPYDAAAKLAYEASDKKMAYADFKVKYEADAVASVIAKRKPAAAPAAAVASTVDISVPYDAAAKLAYEASDKKIAYADFKVKYEADAVASVIGKRKPAASAAPAAASSVDISVPYDAAAKLAYEASDKKMPYADFKLKYEADAVASVIAKRKPAVSTSTEKSASVAVVDISVPYDAPAKLAYEKSDKSMSYTDFKVQYEAEAVAEVIAKRASK